MVQELIIGKKKRWFRTALQIRGSVVPIVFWRSLICGLFGILISILFEFKLPVSLPVLASLIPNIVLGLLLVFRTNTAYERFWEGRKSWGLIETGCCNLARHLWVVVLEKDPKDQAAKIATLRLVGAFAVAIKLYLRNEPVNEELEELIPSPLYLELKNTLSPPLTIAFSIADYLQQQCDDQFIDSRQQVAMYRLLDSIVEAFISCKRILETPIPLAYAIHLKQLLLLYCLSLPFQLVGNLGWWTGLVVVLISFTLFGIEEIGIEIENPFGYDPNDLPLDAICARILGDIDDMITTTPNKHSSKAWLFHQE